MNCPFCGNSKIKVTDKRGSGKSTAIRRRRECLRCKKRFTTYERIEETILTVIKTNGKKEPYLPKKMAAGIIKSCKKLPISEDQIEKAIGRVESKLRRFDEVKSNKIGEYVLRELKKLDEVAYLRFASIYKSFEDINSFKQEFKLLKKKKR